MESSTLSIRYLPTLPDARGNKTVGNACRHLQGKVRRAADFLLISNHSLSFPPSTLPLLTYT